MTDKPVVRLDNWIRAETFLCGEVYDHPRFRDGERVITSTIINELEDGRIETRNTVYVLGEPLGEAPAGSFKASIEEDS